MDNLMSVPLTFSTGSPTPVQPPKPLSVFINQLEGGYTLNLQGNEFYPVKVCVTIDEVKQIIGDFFVEKQKEAPQSPQEAPIPEA